MPAKVIVIIENQNPSARSRALLVKIRRRKPADPAAYNN
jgi:hypothetical protein